MSSTVIINIARFIILLLMQVVVFNRIDLFGLADPYPYILFIILYPVNGNRALLLVSSFLLGLFIDMFTNSGGVHAAASLVLAYVRPSIFKFSFGLSYEYQTIRINEKLSPERFSFILISVVIHHLILYLLEVFRLSFLLDSLLRMFIATLFTLTLCIIIIYLIKPGKQ
ncbi:MULTISPECIES: rod shape-determining protein MreD [Flavobacterium]|uniref:rod shape-determining protein MreD n=1 Tax=Flavobacterium TaxID=237 RepID=UPI000C61FC90|nr:rod shape-determining protein MreD [Flavobacterium sp.]MBF00051.1 rod shape-determining protein MreD [Flavobacterium sp.]|tara:strand:- start:11488 stop:11994 length:507 start_codon:yes stop_codon:yes gene_type:complete